MLGINRIKAILRAKTRLPADVVDGLEHAGLD
jgi:hypothetical protein